MRSTCGWAENALTMLLGRDVRAVNDTEVGSVPVVPTSTTAFTVSPPLAVSNATPADLSTT